MIDIITYSDNHQKILKDLYFIPSFNIHLKHQFNHIDFSINNDLESTNSVGFGSEIFQNMIFERWDILIKHIEKNMDTEKISIFSDIDIVFLGNFYDNIQNLFNRSPSRKQFLHQQTYKKSDIDIYFMPETPNHMNQKLNFNLNAGFFIFRHSQKTLDFFTYVLDFMRKQKIKEDQFYIRKELKNNSYNNIALLDFNVFNTNNCNINLNLSLTQGGSLKVFHATSCSDIYQKMIVLNKITEHMQHNMLKEVYHV